MLALVVGLAQAPQPPPGGMQVAAPVFRAGVQVVPIYVALMFNRQPWTGLTLDDFMVVLDQKAHPPLEVTSDLEKPNHYAIYFKPPDESRDGKKHRLQLRVKRPKSGKWTTLPMSQSITLAKEGGAMDANAVLEALGETRQLLARPDNRFDWSGWANAEAALTEIDAVIEGIRSGASLDATHVGVLFAPTGPIQEVSVSSGWGDAFLALADRIDEAMQHK
jgi:hypothetical protein